MAEQEKELRELAVYKYGFRDEDARYEFVVPKGLSKEVVEAISHYKGEPEWMRKIRLQALEIFFRKPMPTWGADLSELNFDEITYYAAPTKAKFRSWDEVPEYIKRTYERLGIPEAERKFLAGVGAQYDCLTADTVVFANPGAVPIAQIQPGQYVYSLDVENRKLIKQRVRAVVYKGELPVFEVKVAGRRIKATFNHPFLALIYRKEEGKKRGHFEVAWRYLSDLKVGDYIAIVKKLPDEELSARLPKVNSCMDAYTSDEIGFAPIESIRYLGVEPTYDIEVEGVHNFIAEGIVVHNSEVVYHRIREDLERLGVIFVDMDTAVREYPDIVREYFGTVIPPTDNKFAALNTAVWSGGSFVYVPKGVHVEMPLQAYFRINAENIGQFERTLIIAEEGSFVHYVEGCTAPIYSTNSLHSAVVELIAKPGATIRYTTLQNWSHNVYNLVTKRGVAYEDAKIIWVDANIGSKTTMKYPCVYMVGKGARGEVLSVAFASNGQHQDAGAKMIHAAPYTTSIITSKSISVFGGRATYRGMVKVYPGCKGAKVNVRCDALLLDEISRTDTYPVMEIEEEEVEVAHEATVSKIGEEQLFYLQSRGLTDDQAIKMIVNGFFRDFAKELPMEYAVEFTRLIELQLEGSVG